MTKSKQLQLKRMSSVLAGKRVLITGASRGLGRVLATRFHAEGAELLLVARSVAQLQAVQHELGESSRGGVYVLACDLADGQAPEKIIDAAARYWDRLDILVNNAAVLGPVGPFVDNDWEDWKRAATINLFAPVCLAQLTAQWMRATRRGGSIVNLSGGGATSPRPNFSAYACSKTALVRFTEIAAAELASLSIRVNCVAPGVMGTDMLDEIVRAGSELAGESEHRRALSALASDAVMNRAAELTLYLASPESAGITGRIISAVWDPWPTLARHAQELNESDIYTLRRIVPGDRQKAWE